MISLKQLSAAFVAVCLGVQLWGQITEQAYSPLNPGSSVTTRYCDAEGILLNTYTMTIRKAEGDMKNGVIEMVYKCYDKNGTPLLKDGNEFLMTVNRKNGKTLSIMDQMSKMNKVRHLLPVGDASTLPLVLKVGQSIADSHTEVKIGKIKVNVSVSERKVIDHKQISTKAGSYDCYLVHEKVETKTPIGTDVQYADTWYSLGVGAVRQTVYNGKKEVIARQEITAVR